MRELNVLWTQSHDMVLSYIRSIIIDFHAADDVLQETAATVAEKIDTYDRSLPFAPWAIGIAKFKVMEYLRAHSRDRLVFSEAVVESLASAFTEMQVQASETEIALEQCMTRVHGRPRKLLEMRYLRHTSIEEVARSTGMTSTAVRVALYRIRKSLLECIQGQLLGANGPNRQPTGGQ